MLGLGFSARQAAANGVQLQSSEAKGSKGPEVVAVFKMGGVDGEKQKMLGLLRGLDK